MLLYTSIISFNKKALAISIQTKRSFSHRYWVKLFFATSLFFHEQCHNSKRTEARLNCEEIAIIGLEPASQDISS